MVRIAPGQWFFPQKYEILNGLINEYSQVA